MEWLEMVFGQDLLKSILVSCLAFILFLPEQKARKARSIPY